MAEKNTKTKDSQVSVEKTTEDKKQSRKNKQQKGMLCENLSFAAAESYKLLRTNLLFTLPEKNCRRPKGLRQFSLGVKQKRRKRKI